MMQWSLIMGILAILSGLGVYYMPRSAIPAHLLDHTVVFRENLVSDLVARKLLEHMKDIAVFPSNIAADLKTGVKVTTNEEIGESQMLNADGTCSHIYLTPNVNKTLCVLPQRVDVGMSFVQTGGVDGLQESYETMVSRTSSFGQYNFFASNNETKVDINPAVSALFRSEAFSSVAKEVCPNDKQILDPFQYNFIINLPGQTVPLHIDAPTFDGATRTHFPQWFLVAMEFSGLFQDIYIDTVQVVAYLHQWVPRKEDAGDFVYYREDSPRFQMFPSLPRAGSGIDGAKTIHAARTYRPDEVPPMLEKDKHSELIYQGNDEWHVFMGDKFLRKYTTNDLRVSIVYRARCFSSEMARKNYRDELDAGTAKFTVDEILNVFTKDLITKGKLTDITAASISRLDLALMIIKTYIKYPLPSPEIRFLPYNVCALPSLYPTTSYILKYFC